jgi:hypothetical protein
MDSRVYNSLKCIKKNSSKKFTSVLVSMTKDALVQFDK